MADFCTSVYALTKIVQCERSLNHAYTKSELNLSLRYSNTVSNGKMAQVNFQLQNGSNAYLKCWKMGTQIFLMIFPDFISLHLISEMKNISQKNETQLFMEL